MEKSFEIFVNLRKVGEKIPQAPGGGNHPRTHKNQTNHLFADVDDGLEQAEPGKKKVPDTFFPRAREIDLLLKAGHVMRLT